jgi:hypothetical protein
VNGVSKSSGANTASWDGKNDSSSVVPDGAYTYKIDATDAAGNPATQQSGVVTIETVPPSDPGAPFTAKSPTNDTTPVWAWTESTDDNGIAFYLLYFDTVAGETTYHATVLTNQFTQSDYADLITPTLTSLAEGTWHTMVIAFDGASNPSAFSDNGSVTIDLTPPETTIDSGPPSPVNSPSAVFTFSSSETGSTFQCDLDGGGFSSCSSGHSYSTLSAGSHTFSVKATDVAGNEDPSPASYTWTINLCIPPVAGDWEITTECILTDKIHTVTGNLIIQNTGILDMRGTTNIIFESSAARSIYIYPGGQLFQADTAGFNKP